MPKKDFGTITGTPCTKPQTNPNVVSSGEPGCDDRDPIKKPGQKPGHGGHGGNGGGCKG